MFTLKAESLQTVFRYKYFYMISSLSKPNIASFVSCVIKYISRMDPQPFFLAYFKSWTNYCSTISRYNSFLFLFNVIDGAPLLYLYVPPGKSRQLFVASRVQYGHDWVFLATSNQKQQNQCYLSLQHTEQHMTNNSTYIMMLVCQDFHLQ